MADDTPSIYDELGVPRVINAAGTKTRIGGTRIRPEAATAMHRATTEFARISDLQAKASDTISNITGADAGYVASGAAACLTLAAAATITGHDPHAMSRLPQTDNRPNEILIPKVHRNSYDHALRAAGATLTDIGTNDHTLGPGATDLEPWEIEAAITDNTAAIAYVPRNNLPLDPIITTAHDHDLPVIIDAAGQLPPKHNLTRFIDAGADLVIFSGGKAIRGPQNTGIIAGTTNLITAIALQHLDMDTTINTWNPPPTLIDPTTLPGVPRHGIGRGYKVSKEALVGLITALQLYHQEDQHTQHQQHNHQLQKIATALTNIPHITITHHNKNDPTTTPTLEIAIDEPTLDTTTTDIVNQLQTTPPHIYLNHNPTTATLTINPTSLTTPETDTLIDQLTNTLST